jgi:hypothetical protein
LFRCLAPGLAAEGLAAEGLAAEGLAAEGLAAEGTRAAGLAVGVVARELPAAFFPHFHASLCPHCAFALPCLFCHCLWTPSFHCALPAGAHYPVADPSVAVLMAMEVGEANHHSR